MADYRGPTRHPDMPTAALPAIAETPPPQTILGGILILVGIALGTLGFSDQTEADRA